MTMSQLLVAVWATNIRRSWADMPLLPTSTSAAGYHCLTSRPNCSIRWVGTTIHGWATTPRRLSSIAAMNMVPVLPAPTTWSSSTVDSAAIRATASRW